MDKACQRLKSPTGQPLKTKTKTNREKGVFGKRNKNEQNMNENHTDYSCLSRAIWWAKKHGYTMPPLEQAMFDSAGSEPLRESLRRWAIGLIVDHDFARAVFGDEPVDEWGQGVTGIVAWARQVAVELEDGKIMMAEPDQRVFRYLKRQDHNVLFGRDRDDPTQIIDNPEIVEIELKKLYGTIPMRTHRLDGIEVIGAKEAWKWHLQQMAIADNPFVYINKYIDEEMQHPNHREWRK